VLAQEEGGIWMKWRLWVSTAVAVALGIALLMGKDDIIRYNRMRRM
jgi:hypothetical protein